MGAFFLYKTASVTKTDLDLVQEEFVKKGLSKPEVFQLADYTLWLYSKKLMPVGINHRSQGQNSIFVTGTLSYKGNSYTQSMDILFSDILTDKFNPQELIGNHTIIIWIGNKISVIPDRSNILNIYYNRDKTILSNSLLAIQATLGENPELDKLSIAENLLTGYLIGPSTFFKQIKRLEPGDTSTLFENIELIFIPPPVPLKASGNQEEALQKQLAALSTYFQKAKQLADEYGADSGITSGHDSRLNMAFMRKYWANVSYHSHFRKIKDREVEIAELVCKKAGVENKQVEVKPTIEMTEAELEQNLNEAFHFFDGRCETTRILY